MGDQSTRKIGSRLEHRTAPADKLNGNRMPVFLRRWNKRDTTGFVLSDAAVTVAPAMLRALRWRSIACGTDQPTEVLEEGYGGLLTKVRRNVMKELGYGSVPLTGSRAREQRRV